MRTILAATLAVLLASPALAARGTPPGPAGAETVRDPELGSLRRQLASATLIARLKLTADQKKALLKVIDEARDVRADAAKDKDIDAAQAKKKEVLRKAIEEVRKQGELSKDTEAALDDSRELTQDAGEEYRDRAKDLREQVKDILTKEQIEQLTSGPTADKRGKFGLRHGDANGGKKMLLHLFMSDEFRDELAR